MATDIERLVVRLEASVAAFEREMRKASAAADSNASKIERRFERMNSSLGGSVRSGALIGSAIGGAIQGGVSEAIKALSNLKQELLDIEKAAKRTGLSIEQVSALQNAGRAAGVSSDDILKGIEGLGAKANAEFNKGEGDLSEYLKANNSALTDRNGKLKDTNTLLLEASKLVSNAKTEFDKIEIAKLFGLSKDWVDLLEEGPAALKLSVDAAQELGGTFDKEVVQKAAAFDKAWNESWANFALQAKAAIASAASGLASLLQQRNSVFDKINEFFIADKVRRGYALTPDEAAIAKQRFSGRSAGGNSIDAAVRDAERQSLADFRQSELKGFNPGDNGRFIDVKLLARRPSTSPGKSSGGGGGGGGSEKKNDYEREIAQIDRKIEALNREAETYGKGTFAIEKARAAQELEQAAKKAGITVTEEMRAAIDAQSTAYANAKVHVENVKYAHDAMTEATRFAAREFSSFVSDMVSGGKNAERAIMNMTKRLADAALQAALLGEGPLAKLFGLAPTGGSGLGGLFGALFSGLFRSGASAGVSGAAAFGFAGPVARLATGTNYVPYDNMPAYLHKGEMVVPKFEADILRKGGAQSGATINISLAGANGDAAIEAAVQRGVSKGMAAVASGEPRRNRSYQMRVSG